MDVKKILLRVVTCVFAVSLIGCKSQSMQSAGSSPELYAPTYTRDTEEALPKGMQLFVYEGEMGPGQAVRAGYFLRFDVPSRDGSGRSPTGR